MTDSTETNRSRNGDHQLGDAEAPTFFQIAAKAAEKGKGIKLDDAREALSRIALESVDVDEFAKAVDAFSPSIRVPLLAQRWAELPRDYRMQVLREPGLGKDESLTVTAALSAALPQGEPAGTEAVNHLLGLLAKALAEKENKQRVLKLFADHWMGVAVPKKLKDGGKNIAVRNNPPLLRLRLADVNTLTRPGVLDLVEASTRASGSEAICRPLREVAFRWLTSDGAAGVDDLRPRIDELAARYEKARGRSPSAAPRVAPADPKPADVAEEAGKDEARRDPPPASEADQKAEKSKHPPAALPDPTDDLLAEIGKVLGRRLNPWRSKAEEAIQKEVERARKAEEAGRLDAERAEQANASLAGAEAEARRLSNLLRRAQEDGERATAAARAEADRADDLARRLDEVQVELEHERGRAASLAESLASAEASLASARADLKSAKAESRELVEAEGQQERRRMAAELTKRLRPSFEELAGDEFDALPPGDRLKLSLLRLAEVRDRLAKFDVDVPAVAEARG